MSEQAPRPEDTPAVAGPDGTPGAQDQPPYGDPNDPYEKRYHDLRSWTDRVNQETSDLRRERDDWQQERELYQLMNFSEDEDTRRQAAEALGYELEPDGSSQPTEYDDPYEQLPTRIEQIEQQLAQRQQVETESQENALIGEASYEALAQLAGDLDERSQNFVLSYAINALPAVRDPHRRLPNGQPLPVPDIKGAMQEFGLWETERQKNWAKTKRAPYVSAGGQSANEVPDLDTHQGRVDYALQKLAENEQP